MHVLWSKREMINVIVAWVTKNAKDFEQHIPLLWLGERNRRIGSANKSHVLFLEGMHSLNEDYKQKLYSIGYELIDGSTSYGDYSSRFPELNRFGEYEKKCFLRWLIIKDVFGRIPLIHYDGDIVFNESPEEIASQLRSLTFVLQGCPAVVSISKGDWLEQYENNFLIFVKDIDTYSEMAWHERNGWEISNNKKWAGCRFRKVISSDQDLISHLIHTDKLPQDSPNLVTANTNLMLFNDPLYFFGYYQEMLPLKYERVDGVDYFNNKRIAFWHMQSDFIRYLTIFARRGFLNNLSRCQNYLEGNSIENTFWRFYNFMTNRRLNRLEIYKYFFEKDDFSGIFNDAVFWKKSVFTRKII